MVPRRFYLLLNPLRQGLVGLVLLVLAGCGTTQHQGSQQDDKNKFNRSDATAVMMMGYDSIAQKHIDPIHLPDLALEAMRGLGSIEPAIAVKRQGNRIIVTGDGDELGNFPVPRAENVHEWARITLDVTDAARYWSHDLKEAESERIFEALFDGALSTLDIYSRYDGNRNASENRSKRHGFGGIGIKFNISQNRLFITDIQPDMPAELAGLKPGDEIVRIDGVPIRGFSKYVITKMIRGPIATDVRLAIRRDTDDKALLVSLKREKIYIQTVSSEVIDGILYARISGFNDNTVDSLTKAVKKARKNKKAPLKGIVLDLRGNRGGLLSQSIKIADLFLDQGEIIHTEGRHPETLQNYFAHPGDIASGLPMAVLVDGKSASAAEVLTLALQDQARAVVIGTTTFGKGSVQTIIPLPNNGEIVLTWSYLVAPSGYTYHRLGVLPSLCTSGLADTNHIKLEKLIPAVSADEWRSPPVEAQKARSKLRESCLAERRKGKIEKSIAREVINNSFLYARALGASTATAEAPDQNEEEEDGKK